MNIKQLILILFITFSIYSCKEKEPEAKNIEGTTTETVEVNVKEEKKDNNIRLNFKGIFNEDDLFLIYYSTKENQTYSNKNVLTQKIEGSDKLQNIEILFPKNAKPYDLRIDFSDNKNQNEIIFKELKVSDSLNTIIINKKNIRSNFNFDSEKVSFNQENSKLKGNLFKIKEGAMGYNPFFNSNVNYRSALKAFNTAHSKKTKTETLIDTQNINIKDGEFRVIIEGTFESNDDILLFYTDDSSKPLNKKLTRKVKGNTNPQTIIFTLPNEDFLVDFRLDISDNIKQKNIELDRISIIELNSIIEIDKSKILENFITNEYIDIDTNGNINLKVIEDGKIKKYNPYFLLSDTLKKKMLKF